MAAGNFRDIIDKPDWRIVSPMVNNTGNGTNICFDETNTSDRFLGVFQFVSNTILNQYNPANDGSTYVGSPGMSGTFGAGANSVFMPSAGPRGTIAAGATTTTITPSATLGATIPQNRLASRGIVGTGFRIRIIDNGAGGTGKTEERIIIANTSSTTPLIKLNTPLSFTPVSGSSFELLSGRVFLLSAGAPAAGQFKYYDIATNTFSGNLSVTNLPTVATDSQMIVLDELYNPKNRNAYEGFVGKITASASGINTITATLVPDVSSTGGVEANQFRNFQIRIVEDTVNVTAVGQRNCIASHTSGTTPVFTMYTNWTVTPSSSAKFVIEYPNEIIFHTATTAMYTYTPYIVRNNATPQAADTWSSTRYGARSTTAGVGMMTFAPFGFTFGDTSVDPLLLHRPSKIVCFRGNNGTALDILDIAAGTNGTWTNNAPYNSIGTAFTTGSCIAYDSVGEDGKFAYISVNGGQYFVRYNVFTNDISEWAFLRQTQSTVVVGTRMYTTHAYNSEGGVVPILGHVLCSSNIQHECFITT